MRSRGETRLWKYVDFPGVPNKGAEQKRRTPERQKQTHDINGPPLPRSSRVEGRRKRRRPPTVLPARHRSLPVSLMHHITIQGLMWTEKSLCFFVMFCFCFLKTSNKLYYCNTLPMEPKFPGLRIGDLIFKSDQSITASKLQQR